MKITGSNGVNGVTGVYNNKGVRNVEKTNRIIGKDQVSVSQAGQDYNTVMKALKDVPDVRQDKVEELTSKISSGTYDVASQDIIDKLAKGLAEKRG